MKKNILVVLVVLNIILSLTPVWATSTSAQQDAALTIYSANVGYYATAIGYNPDASGSYATAIGYNTEARAQYAFAVGRYTLANEQDAFAAGRNTAAMGISSTAMGYLTNATGNYSTVFGHNSTANGTNSSAMGTALVSGGKSSLALGNEMTVLGDYSVGIGLNDFVGTPPTINANNVLVIMGGKVGIDVDNPLSKLAISALPTSPPGGSGVKGMLCIMNDGNVWVDDDGTYDCA